MAINGNCYFVDCTTGAEAINTQDNSIFVINAHRWKMKRDFLYFSIKQIATLSTTVSFCVGSLL